jgi:predicted aminopeptidase
MKKNIFIFVLIVFAVVSGCSSIGYYTQSVVGHTSLMMSRKPVSEVMQNADQKFKQRLVTAQEIRQFAIEVLGLPNNKSYTTYVKLKGDSPVWNVVAAEEFSLQAKQWCYLVIGCASYRGYYRKEAAEKYAQGLKDEGFDVYVGGATAYSTLGWFADPLTSAMFQRGDAFLAELVFHELAHQQVYVSGDSRFNEAFASAVGEQGAILWMQQTGRKNMLNEYLLRQTVRDDFLEIINEIKLTLSKVYESDIDPDKMRVQKKATFQIALESYKKIKQEKWQGKGWYDRWFGSPINNARLVAIATYRDLVPDFVALFDRCDKNFSRFYLKVEEISKTNDRNLGVDCQLETDNKLKTQ